MNIQNRVELYSCCSIYYMSSAVILHTCVFAGTTRGSAEPQPPAGGLSEPGQSGSAPPRAADQGPVSNASWLLDAQPLLPPAQTAVVCPEVPHAQSLWNHRLPQLWQETGLGFTRSSWVHFSTTQEGWELAKDCTIPSGSVNRN